MSILINHATSDRQQRALELHIEGFGYGKISKQLFDEGYAFNGKPYSRTTVKSDIKRVVAGWEEYMMDTLQAHRAAHYAKAEYIWDRALEMGELRIAIDALKVMMQLLGTPAPQRHEVSHEVVPIAMIPANVFDEI